MNNVAYITLEQPNGITLLADVKCVVEDITIIQSKSPYAEHADNSSEEYTVHIMEVSTFLSRRMGGM